MKPLIFALLIIAPCLSYAEQKVDTSTLKHPVNACLFKIEGNGLTAPSWLFGTIHLGQKNLVTLHPNAEAAFTGADAVYTEIDLDPKSQMAIMPLMIRKDGTTFTKAIGPEMTKKLDQALATINPALKARAFDPMKTWVVAATLPLLKMQLKQEKALDDVLYQRAMKEEKKVGALETAASQVAVFDQFSEEDLQSMLSDSIDTIMEDKDEEVDSVTRLANVYLTGDIHKIAKFLKSEIEKSDTNPEFTKRLIKALLDDRNIGMADKSHEIMSADPSISNFIAVGAGHYTGETAVQDLLVKKGYKVTPHFK